jgi:hypothetical protein
MQGNCLLAALGLFHGNCRDAPWFPGRLTLRTAIKLSVRFATDCVATWASSGPALLLKRRRPPRRALLRPQENLQHFKGYLKPYCGPSTVMSSRWLVGLLLLLLFSVAAALVLRAFP